MRCPHCTSAPSSVKQTTRPINEGLEHGDIKRRLRKCRNCQKMFTTFEIHEGLFRGLRGVTEELVAETAPAPRELKRQRLLVEEVNKRKPVRGRLAQIKGSEK